VTAIGLLDLLTTARQGRIPERIDFRPTPLLAQAVRRTLKRLSDRDAAAPVADLAEVQRRLRQAVTDGTMHLVSAGDRRLAPYCLWMGERPYLADERAFMTGFLGWTAASPTRGATRALIRVYLSRFDMELPGFAEIATALRGLVERWNWEWRDRARGCAIFDPREGPGKVAALALTAGPGVLKTLDDLGLEGPFATSAFATAALAKAAAQIDAELRRPTHGADIVARIEAIARWICPAGKLRHQAMLGRVAEALLLPWCGRTPPDDIRRSIQDTLVGHYGDPRLMPKSWRSVSEQARRVVLSWLTKASLDQFLEIVGMTAKAHQWEYRKAFWTAYFERGHIQQSWVVFARNPRAIATQLAADSQDPSMRSFGELTGSGPDQAVLLLEINGLTIADWSFDGKCRIWTSANETRPELYRHGRQDAYAKADLIDGCDFAKAHQGQGTWQSKVASFIGQHTSVWLSSRDYMPKGVS
jgi:hypothetical protein